MIQRSIAVLAAALLACASVQAAPKTKHAAPAKKAAAANTAAADIDVDAMARAKDGKPTEPLKTDVDAAASTDAATSAAGPESAQSAPADAAAKTAEAADATATESDSVKPQNADSAAEAPDEAAASEAEALDETAASEAAAPSQTDAPAEAAQPQDADTSADTQATADTAPHAEAADAAQAAPTERPSPLAPPPAPTDTEKSLAAACEARATSLLDAAQKGDYEGATRDFDAKMRTGLPPAKFGQAWESLAQFGAFQARGQAHPMKGDGYIAITIPLIFDKANLYAQIACGSDGRVAGFYVKPL